MTDVEILHHGGKDTVTGSCHEVRLTGEGARRSGILIDCGLLQGGEETPSGGEGRSGLQEIDFPVAHLEALVVTHVHLDHVGRIPQLLAAGFRGRIYCSEPSARLLPLVLEDAVRVGLTRDRRQVERLVREVERRVVALPYGEWRRLESPAGAPSAEIAIRLKPAGHILGSAYVEVDLRGAGPLRLVPVPGQTQPTDRAPGQRDLRVVFSGDLGAPYAPLLPAPRSPWRADMLVLESTYGDSLHEGRRERRERLREVIERCLENRGAILVPAFAMGRTQELLYELEELIHANRTRFAAKNLPWPELEVIVDSPLASRFTAAFRELRQFWDAEAHRKLRAGRRPLAFEQVLAIDSHQEHLQTVAYLKKSARPCIVIAASGMCSGGRIVNYLKELLPDPRSDVLFVGYQAAGTPVRDIQKYGPGGGWVRLDGRRIDIRAGIHTISGFSAHADQQNLVDFVRRMRVKPQQVRLIHGEPDAQAALAARLRQLGPDIEILS